MVEEKHHSRREFLQGKAAARALADRVCDWAQEWVGSASEMIADRFPTSPAIHVEASRRAMACDFAIRYHEVDRGMAGDVLEAFDLIESIEGLLTIYRETSDIVELNRFAATGPASSSPEIINLLLMAENLYCETGGAFDVTATPLSRIWGFLKREGRLPSDAEIAAAMELIGMSHVTINAADYTVLFDRLGMEINFNALGKGYALDQAAGLLQERGSSDFLWHGGRSSILARGINRADDKDCWTIGLRDPLARQGYLAEFHLRNQALGTSGGATQYFEHEGRRYSHILDPRTGWPAEGVYTATVVAESAAQADALSTAAFVLGPSQIRELCDRRPDVGVVLVCPADNEFGMTVAMGNMRQTDWTPLCDPCMITTV